MITKGMKKMREKFSLSRRRARMPVPLMDTGPNPTVQPAPRARQMFRDLLRSQLRNPISGTKHKKKWQSKKLGKKI